MIELLFGLNLVLLGVIYFQLNGRLGRIISVFYAAYMGAFIILKPALNYYLGLFLPFSTNAPAAVVHYMIGNLIFLVVQSAGIRLFADRPPAAYAARLFDFDQASPRGIVIAFLVLMAVSFVGSTIKFGTPAYLFQYLDTFAAAAALSSGSYYLNFVAEILGYGALMVIACTYWRYPPARSFLVVLLVLGFTFFWTRPSYRTGILVAILAWASCAISVRRQRRWGIVRLGLLGYFLLMVLYVANFVRLGNADALGERNIFISAVTGATADMVPVDDAMLLYQRMTSHDLVYFAYLPGALTPLSLVPSALMPFKPRADKDSSLTEMFFPHGADTRFFHEGSTLTFTVPASSYADAFYFGVLVASVIFMLLFCWYMRIFRHGSRSARYFAAYLLMLQIAAFRLSIETVLLGFYVTILLIGVTRFLALMASGEPVPQALPPQPA